MPINGRARTAFRQERLSNSRVRLVIKDIYYGVEGKLDDYDYRYDSRDIEEFVASVLDMYLDSADRGFGRAAVDMRAAFEIFQALVGGEEAKQLSRIRIQQLVLFILAELGDYLRTFEIVRVYDYTIFGSQLAIDCLRRVEIKAVA